MEKATQQKRDNFRPPRHYKKMNSTESNRISGSPSVSPSFSQQDFNSRSPSPNQFEPPQPTQRNNNNYQNKLHPQNRAGSRSPSPVLQAPSRGGFLPQIPTRNVNIQARQQHHQQSTIVNEQGLRKLPPVPGNMNNNNQGAAGGGRSRLPQPPQQLQQMQNQNFRQISEESGDEYVPTNRGGFGNNNNSNNHQYIPMANVQTQQRKMPSITNQPMRVGNQSQFGSNYQQPQQRFPNQYPGQQLNQQRGPHNTVVSYNQYGDNEEEENENWF